MPLAVLVGTTKGVFVLRPDAGAGWTVSGPHCDGWPINHVIGDASDGCLWAAGGGEWPGAGVWRSTDGGESWVLSQLSNGKMDDMLTANPGMAEQFGLPAPVPAPWTGAVEAVWSLARVGDRLLAGCKPAALYDSHDGGVSWAPVHGLADHPSRAGWEPGAAGLVLHSIVTDPDNPARLWVGISAAGVFATEDGGATWDRRNRVSNLGAAASRGHGHDDGHELGLCVHNIVRGAGDVMYQQNHHGVFRSQDAGRAWAEISAGLPSKFGFPVAVHPRDPMTAWVLPLNGDTAGRFPPDASAAVWRTRDGGQSWSRLGQGLPDRNCYFTVLRQAMATDQATPAGVYFGTNSGSVFASRDEGDTWTEIVRHLPTVLSVEVMCEMMCA